MDFPPTGSDQIVVPVQRGSAVPRLGSSAREWLVREEQRLRPSLPVSGRLRSGRRTAAALFVLVYIAVAVTCQVTMGPGGDSTVFTTAGRTLLSSRWSDAFANGQVQSGPLFLLLEGLGSRLTAGSGLPPYVGGGVLTALASACLLTAAARTAFRAYGCRDVDARTVGVGLVFVAAGGLWLVSIYAHPDDLLVTLLLILAAASSARDRHLSAGALFGLAVGIKLWALVAVGVLLLRLSRRSAVRAAAVAAGVVAVLYGPFFVVGHVNTFHWTWEVEDPAPLHLFLATDSHFTWGLRLGQAALAAALGTAAARQTYRSPAAIWLVPAAAIAGRLLLDPRGLLYYYPPLLLCLLLGYWATSGLSVFATALTALPGAVLVVGIFVVATGTVGSVWISLVCLVVVALALQTRRAS